MGAKNSTARLATPPSHKATDPASSSSTKMLRKSVFFKARLATPCSHGAPDPASASKRASTSSPSGHYSARIRELMKHRSEPGVSETDAAIGASRAHWTETDEEYCTALATGVEEEWAGSTLTERELYEENVKAMRKLQEDYPESKFFVIDEEGEGELGRMIAEGGQGSIHEIGPQHYFHRPDGVWPVVRKVFKAGYRVSELQKQWPLAFLHKYAPVNAPSAEVNPVLHGRLLGDGRFAFDTLRWWGDLRKLLDVRMQYNGNQRPPFMRADGNYDECCMFEIMVQIADGMKGMHNDDTLHRDLKASNVFIDSVTHHEDLSKEIQLDPLELKHDMVCGLADYECSIGVEGTGFWRAPEILEALEAMKKIRKDGTNVEAMKKIRKDGTNVEAMRQFRLKLFTEKSDVYSYAMICYEILTGYIPFENEVTIAEVLGGKRPKLPNHLRVWMKKLLNSCWNKDASKRPTFEEIAKILRSIKDSDLGCQSESEIFKFHDFTDAYLKLL